MFQIPTLEPKKHEKSVLYLMQDYNFNFLKNVYLEFFIQGFYQHLTELGQLNWQDNLRYAEEIKTFKNLKNTSGAVVRRCSVKKGVLRNFTKFTGKHLRDSLFFNTVAGLEATEHLWWLLLVLVEWSVFLYLCCTSVRCNFIKKGALAQVFSVHFAEFPRTPFLTKHFQWLLLSIRSL